MTDTIEINGKKLRIASNALLPRLYRYHFGRDLVVDMRKFGKAYVQVGTDESGKPIYEIADEADTSILENVSWLMLRQGGEDVPDTIEAWLEETDMFDLYEIEHACLSLWQKSERQTATLKKKGGRPQG